MKNLLILLVSVFLSSSVLFAQMETNIVDYNNFDTTLVKKLLLEQINRYRSKYNLPPMKFDKTTGEFAEYDASYVNLFSTPKSSSEVSFFYLFDFPHEGILLKTPLERLDYFSSLNRVNRKLFTCINSSGFSRSDFVETYSNFAITTLLTWLQADDDYDKILQYNVDGDELVGIGVSFKEIKSSESKGYEVYVNIAITTEK